MIGLVGKEIKERIDKFKKISIVRVYFTYHSISNVCKKIDKYIQYIPQKNSQMGSNHMTCRLWYFVCIQK